MEKPSRLEARSTDTDVSALLRARSDGTIKRNWRAAKAWLYQEPTR
jgi:hypothetical protein